MSRKISDAFASGKAFIPFITCGDPSLEITEQLVYAMEEAGADLIELGIPFSDPTAEGPVIQAANVRALSGGVTTDKIFEMVERIRKKTEIWACSAQEEFFLCRLHRVLELSPVHQFVLYWKLQVSRISELSPSDRTTLVTWRTQLSKVSGTLQLYKKLQEKEGRRRKKS